MNQTMVLKIDENPLVFMKTEENGSDHLQKPIGFSRNLNLVTVVKLVCLFLSALKTTTVTDFSIPELNKPSLIVDFE
jgi:hypothetical protein